MKINISWILVICLCNLILIPSCIALDTDNSSLVNKPSSSAEIKVAGAKVLLFLTLFAVGGALIKRAKSKLENGKLGSESLEIIGQQIINGGTRVSVMQARGKNFIVATSSTGSISLLSLEQNSSQAFGVSTIDAVELRREYFNA